MEIMTPKILLAFLLYFFGIPAMAASWHSSLGGTWMYWVVLALFILTLGFCIPMLKRDSDEIQEDLKRWDARLAREKEREQRTSSTW